MGEERRIYMGEEWGEYVSFAEISRWKRRVAELEGQLNLESDAYALLRDENAALRQKNEQLLAVMGDCITCSEWLIRAENGTRGEK